MKNFKKQLENELNGIVEDIRFYDVRGDIVSVINAENVAADVKAQLEMLDAIMAEREGNLICFNADGTFNLRCIRVPEGGEQIVEEYNVDLTFEDYDELLETADCIDVSDIFSTEAIAHLVVIENDIDNCDKRDVYYFVSNETIESAILSRI